MSEETEKKPKKGKGLMVKALGGIALLALGGGGVFALIQTGMIGGHAEAKEDNNPKLIRKGQEDPYAPKAEGGEEGGAEAVYGEGGSEYRTAYYTFDGDFTANLKGSDSLIQVSLAASTRRDGRVLMWEKEHELAIRSALLAVLADTTEDEVTTIEGKARLQKRLTAAINKVLVEEEGFGGVDDVFFRSFIVQ
jgi:flagellar FliL protein